MIASRMRKKSAGLSGFVIDTYWLSMEDMVACMGYGTLLGVPDLIARYERKYIDARSAHSAPVFADLRAQQRAMSEA